MIYRIKQERVLSKQGQLHLSFPPDAVKSAISEVCPNRFLY